MVKFQLQGRDIYDERVLKAMSLVPREKFVPSEYQESAYFDGPVPIGFNQTISQPYVVALMCQLLELKGNEKVLDIGTGSGYQAAILSFLAKEVISIERIPQLAKRAESVLKKLGCRNVKVIVGDGNRGFSDEAPFDAIVCAAATRNVPEAWKEQLTDGGRLVFPQETGWAQELVRLTKRGKRFLKENFGGVAFVPLIKNHTKSRLK